MNNIIIYFIHIINGTNTIPSNIVWSLLICTIIVYTKQNSLTKNIKSKIVLYIYYSNV